MKRAVLLLAVVACVAAAPTAEPEPAAPTAEPEPAAEPREGEVLPPPPPPRQVRAADEDERAKFLSILEELQAVSRGERPDTGYNYFALIGVFEDPVSGKPLVFAERVPMDLSATEQEEARRRRRQLAPVHPLFQH